MTIVVRSLQHGAAAANLFPLRVLGSIDGLTSKGDCDG